MDTEPPPPPAPLPPHRPLSAREIRFAQILVESGPKRSKTQAYLDAGFPAKKTREDTKTAACRLYRKRPVREYVAHLQDVAARAARVTVAGFAAGVARIAEADLRKLYDKDGCILPVHEWPDELALVVESVENEDGFPKKVKMGSVKLSAWRLLGEWKRAIGADKSDGTKAHDPLVVGGDANPGAL